MPLYACVGEIDVILSRQIGPVTERWINTFAGFHMKQMGRQRQLMEIQVSRMQQTQSQFYSESVFICPYGLMKTRNYLEFNFIRLDWKK